MSERKRYVRFSSEEVADYLIDRLMPVRQFNIKKRKKGASIRNKTPGVFLDQAAERRITELSRLVPEMEDMLKQIRLDEATLQGRFDSTSLDHVLNVLDSTGAQDSVDLRRLAVGIMPSQGIENSIEEARLRIAETRSRITSLIGDNAVREGYKSQLQKKIDVIRSARSVDSLRKLSERSELARMELLAQRNRENTAFTRADSESLRKYDLIRKTVQEKTELLMADQDVYYEAKRRLLLDYRRQLLTDGFVETPTVKREIIRIISHLQLGIPVLLRGHLGAGKTEVALHVSRTYFGCEPEFISGSEESTKYDIYGRTQIGSRTEEDKRREFRARMDEFRRMNPEAPHKEVKEVEKQFYQAIIVKGLTTSFFQYGPLVRAMKEGKPLIIDEMDGIPHSIVMRLNHVLTRRAGDRITVQEDGGEDITVHQGFCVIATGNIKSFRYKREELDAAFLSRWWSDDIVYPPQNETYEILVASLLDRRGNLQTGKENDLDEIKRLTMAATEIQKIFSGEHLDYFGEGADAARKIPASLKKSVLSLRNLWNIVRPWKAHNFDRSLEDYILNEFIKPSVAEDQAYLVQLFCRYRFYKNRKADDLGIPGLTDGKLLAFQGKSKEQPAE